jgi:hypothetical protein
MEKTLNKILAASDSVAALVGGHISPIKRDDATSSITYELSGTDSTMFANGKTSSIKTSEFTIIARAEGYKKAVAIADSIKDTLLNLVGTFDDKKILLTQFNGEQHSQYVEQEISEINLNYTFHHN